MVKPACIHPIQNDGPTERIFPERSPAISSISENQLHFSDISLSLSSGWPATCESTRAVR